MRTTSSFEQLGPLAAFATGLAGLAYSISFSLYLHHATRGSAYANALLLVAGGLASTLAFTAVYERLRETDPPLALWGFVLALVGAFGAALHGGYDLANLANPPKTLAADLPSSVDPRGLGTFALTGLAVAVAGGLILRGHRLPRGLGLLGLLAAALLVFVYVGRLVILDPKSPGLLAAAVASGYVVNPLWFGWLGLSLRRGYRLPQEGAGTAASVSASGAR
ncbi:MAG TPA: hypothetical protein VE982_07005 [Gaiellaceae bacterium]|nr:hypothetical protein [Gaiellaceae bacterium]